MVVGDDDEVRLIDYGLSLLFDPPLVGNLTTHDCDVRLGVFGYMAPELFRHRRTLRLHVGYT